jgi:superfamily II DNA or RNA helicase
MEISTEEQLELRRYQASSENRVFREWEKGSKNILMQLPTGGGKTSIFSSIAQKFLSKNLRVLIVAHKEELVLQNAKSLEKWCNYSCGLIKAGYKPDYNLNLQSASIQSLINRWDLIGNFDLIIIDEAHRSPSNIYSSLFEFPEAKILGVTATPIRNDKKEFADLYDVLVSGIQTRQLIKRGYLSNYRFFTDRNPMKWQAARIIDGDFSASDIAGMNDIVELSSSVIESYKLHGEDGTCLVFAVNVDHSLKIVEAYNRAGISAIHLDANSTRKYRKEVLDKLAAGNLKIISNVALFGEGLDIPGLNCVQIVRPTQSLGLHLQMLGRVLRKSADKEYAIVLDHTENYERLGFADDDRHWSLDRQPIVVVVREPDDRSAEKGSEIDELHGIRKTELIEITAAEREAKRQQQKESEREERKNKREAERQKKAALKLQEEQAEQRRQHEERLRIWRQQQEQEAAEQDLLNNRNNRRQDRKAIAQQQIAELTARIMKALQDEQDEDDRHCAAILNKRNSKLEAEKIKELERIKIEQNALKRKLALAGLNRRQEWERIRSVVNVESREDAIHRLRNLEDHKYIFFIESPLLDDLSIEGIRLLIREYYDIELFNSQSSAKEIWRFIVERLTHYESNGLRTKKWATELLEEMPTPKWVWQEIATAFEYKPGWVHYKYNAEKELNPQNIQGENLIIDELWDCVLSQLMPATRSLFGSAKLRSITNDLVTIEMKPVMINLAGEKIPELTKVLSRNLGRSISIQFVGEKYNSKGNTTANSRD